MICQICGRSIPTYTVGDFFPWQCPGHTGGNYPNILPDSVYPTKHCDHCYCKKDFEMTEEWKKMPHKVCCNCGNKQRITV